jgi:16S rRNA (cytidine1402-2'-O)-methyltransferase
MKGTLYIVPTPIGNLEDMTMRSVRILKSSDLILCENTSVTQKLLSYYEIDTDTTVYFAQTKLKQTERILSLLREGKQLALVSDAGTPTISDPGVLLIDTIRRELPEVTIIPLPGSSALTTALSASGISSAQFIFLGFLPQKKGRETLFKEIRDSKRTVVFYESVHRIEKALVSLEEVLSKERSIVVARELTKMHEEVVRGSASEIKNYFLKKKDHVRGEFVVIVEGKK